MYYSCIGIHTTTKQSIGNHCPTEMVAFCVPRHATSHNFHRRHTPPKVTGLAVMSPCIAAARLQSMYNAITASNIERACVILKDTIRVFRTAKSMQFDTVMYNYLMDNFLHMSIEIRTGDLESVFCRLHNMYTCVMLPDDIM